MNRDELSVYADELQIRGDLRGEIIALELQAPRPDIEARHLAMMQRWLGFDPRGIPGVRFRFGFVHVVGSALARVIGTPAAPFVRSVFVTGTNTDALGVLRTLASEPRLHLTRLAILTARRFGEQRGPKAPFVVDAELTATLVRATPSLEYLDVVGNRLFASFPHPSLQRLRVVGHDAIAALVEAGGTMPSVRDLVFAFSCDPYGRIAFGEHGLPRTLLARETLPSLATLDVGPNELQRTWEDRHVAVFELLSELGVLAHLHRLRVPTVRSEEEAAALAHARSQIRALELLETGNDLPAPLHDELEAPSLSLAIANHAAEQHVSMRRLGELVAARWSTFDDDTCDAWLELWSELASVPLEPEDFWMYEQQPAADMLLAPWRAPLASLGDSVDDDFAISELAAVVARSREVRVFVRRRR
ncbi:MAG: hypothetical protein M4D80_29745 [Myxococcota bacterium]|nr:hypothetical protein [Myxococcota bacterium]